MLIIVIIVVGLSLLILGHEAGHFFAAKAFGLKVNEFGFGFPPRIAAWKKGETEYSVNWLPFGGFVKIGGERGEFEMYEAEGQRDSGEGSRLLYAQPAWKKSVIMLAGVFMNFILGWVFLSIVLMTGAPQALVITGIEPNSPASQAGIMANDIVKGFTTAQSFISFVNARKGMPTQFAVIRNNKEVDFTITPRTNTGPNEGALGVLLDETGQAREGFLHRSATDFWTPASSCGSPPRHSGSSSHSFSCTHRSCRASWVRSAFSAWRKKPARSGLCTSCSSSA